MHHQKQHHQYSSTTPLVSKETVILTAEWSLQTSKMRVCCGVEGGLRLGGRQLGLGISDRALDKTCIHIHTADMNILKPA